MKIQLNFDCKHFYSLTDNYVLEIKKKSFVIVKLMKFELREFERNLVLNNTLFFLQSQYLSRLTRLNSKIFFGF